jgi:histidyl-tRNA synthetase
MSVVHHLGGGNFSSQMKKADASGARIAVIIGDTEAARGEVSVREVVRQAESQIAGDAVTRRTGQGEAMRHASTQERVALELLPNAIRKILKETIGSS